MKALDFVYWLQGFLEIQNPQSISEDQVKIIKDHINLVLKKETPGLEYLSLDNDKITIDWSGMENNFIKYQFEGS